MIKQHNILAHSHPSAITVPQPVTNDAYMRVNATISGGFQEGSLNGEEYYIFPTIALKEGTLNANTDSHVKGATYIPKQELYSTVDRWNNMPLLLDHPPMGTSARDPNVMNSQGIGHIFNARVREDHTGASLVVDAWISKRQAQSNPAIAEIVNDVSANLIRDVSVGYGSKVAYTNNSHNGVPFSSISYNIAPDHLAVLPKGVPGACSVAHGCGLANTYAQQACSCGGSCASCSISPTTTLYPQYSFNPMETIMNTSPYIQYLVQAPANPGVATTHAHTPNAVNSFTTNTPAGTVLAGPNVQLPFPATPIVGTPAATQVSPVINAAPANQVQYVDPNTQVATVQNVPVNQTVPMNAAPTNQVQPMVIYVQAPPAQNVATTTPVQNVPAVTDPNAGNVAMTASAANTVPATTATPVNQVTIGSNPNPSMDAWLANAPVGAQHLVAEAMNHAQAAKQTSIANILASSANAFTAEQLNAMDVNTLANLSKMAATTTATTQANGTASLATLLSGAGAGNAGTVVTQANAGAVARPGAYWKKDGSADFGSAPIIQ